MIKHMKPLLVVVLAVAGMLCTACDPLPDPPDRTRPITEHQLAGITQSQECVVGPRGQADRRCDPGALNPDVTQNTIHQTICVSRWSEKVRPPTSYTSKMRDEEIPLYYPPGTPATAVRQDHLIAQTLGGHLTSRLNLWPQPVKASYTKNAHGRRLQLRVCRGEMTLADAQQEILRTWTH